MYCQVPRLSPLCDVFVAQFQVFRNSSPIVIASQSPLRPVATSKSPSPSSSLPFHVIWRLMRRLVGILRFQMAHRLAFARQPHISDHSHHLQVQLLITSAMDMSPSSNDTSAMEVMMTPWLHFVGGDNLFFKKVHPSSGGAIVGACFVLVLVAIFERWVSGMRGSLEAYWRQK